MSFTELFRPHLIKHILCHHPDVGFPFFLLLFCSGRPRRHSAVHNFGSRPVKFHKRHVEQPLFTSRVLGTSGQDTVINVWTLTAFSLPSDSPIIIPPIHECTLSYSPRHHGKCWTFGRSWERFPNLSPNLSQKLWSWLVHSLLCFVILTRFWLVQSIMVPLFWGWLVVTGICFVQELLHGCTDSWSYSRLLVQKKNNNKQIGSNSIN